MKKQKSDPKPNTSRKLPNLRLSRKDRKLIVSALLLIVFSVGTVVGLRLLKQSQESRTRAVANGVEIFFNPSELNLSPGESTQVDLIMNSINGPNNYCVAGADVTITYDSNVINIDNITFTDPLNQVLGGPLIDNSTSPATARFIVGARVDGVLNASYELYGSHTIATVSLTAQSSDGSTSINFDDAVNISAELAVDETALTERDPQWPSNMESTPCWLGNTTAAPEPGDQSDDTLDSATITVSSTPSGAASLYFSESSLSVEAGRTQPYSLQLLANTDSQDISGIDAKITFDPTYISIDSITEGSSGFVSYPAIDFDNTNGTINISANIGGTAPPVNGSSIHVATIYFDGILEVNPTEMAFDFNPPNLNDSNMVAYPMPTDTDPQDILASVANTTIVVTAPVPPSATPVPPTNTPN